jgi:acetyl-CoA C-acetyltransferase
LKAIAERNKLNTAEVDDVIFGTSSQRGRQSGDLARMAALEAGYDVRSSGITLDRFCGSGISAVSLAAMSIMSGTEDLVIGGGAEMMSVYGEEGAMPSMFMDNGNLALRALHPQPHQGVCADAIASMEKIDRTALDALAYVSQQRAAHAINNGYFAKSLVPVYSVDGTLALDKEEFPRPQTTLEGLAELKASFAPVADYPLDESGTDLPQHGIEKISRPRHRRTCTMRAIPPASWMALVPCCWHRRTTPRRTA